MNAVFITGGAGGAGRAIGAAFARRGLHVALVDIDPARTAQAAAELTAELASDLAAEHPTVRVLPLPCDVTRRDAVAAAWRAARAALGTVDVLVNNAGRYRRTELQDLDDATWDATLALNLKGPLMTCQQAIGDWLAHGTPGAIVNVSSVSHRVGGFGGAYDYAASKAGLVGLSIQLAVDFAPHGIRTNVVSPGSFRSLLNLERLAVPGAEAASAAIVPLRRIGEAHEIAAAVLFLALDGTYVNGEEIRCDGGTTVAALRPAASSPVAR